MTEPSQGSSNPGTPSWPSLVKGGAEAAKTVLEIVAPQRAHRSDAKKQIMAAITELALAHPEQLTEAHIAYAERAFGDEESDFINWVYVQEQSKKYTELLLASGFAERILPGSIIEEPSFERNLQMRLRELSPDDRVMLELYAQIRAGHSIQPGSFSKRTCNIVAELTAEAILALEAVAPHVIHALDTRGSAFIPKYSDTPMAGKAEEIVRITVNLHHCLSFAEVATLQEYGLVASGQVHYSTIAATSFRLPGGAIISVNGGQKVGIPTYALTRAGVELLQLHVCEEPAEGLTQWLLGLFPPERINSVVE
jgi:hypothetical protein